MTEISHRWGADLGLSASGDLALASGAEAAEQRILRRLLTNPGDYIWHPDYGAGLGRFVGQPADPQRIAAVARRQVLLEDSVARIPEPRVSVRVERTGEVLLNIEWTFAESGQRVSTSATVTG